MKHPRTLNEAFPSTLEYGAAIEIPYKDPWVWKVKLALAFTCAILLVPYVF